MKEKKQSEIEKKLAQKAKAMGTEELDELAKLEEKFNKPTKIIFTPEKIRRSPLVLNFDSNVPRASVASPKLPQHI